MRITDGYANGSHIHCTAKWGANAANSDRLRIGTNCEVPAQEFHLGIIAHATCLLIGDDS